MSDFRKYYMEDVVHLSNAVVHLVQVPPRNTVWDAVFKIFIFSHYYGIWINMIQIKSIAMLIIAIAIVGAIGTAELLVQHANAEKPSGNPGATVLYNVQCNTPAGILSNEGHKVFPASGGAANLACHA